MYSRTPIWILTGGPHIKIDVAGRTARAYLNNSTQPTLTVDGMKGEDLRGAVALWATPARSRISPTYA